MSEASADEPRKHHYIPAFYLKQWSGADEKLCEYQRVASGKIVPHRKFPAGTGYKQDLYRVDGLSGALAQEIESKFMRGLDTKANNALQKIIRDDQTPWDSEMSSAWVRFILSLRFRNPESVSVIKHQMLDVWKAAFDRLKADYDKLRHENDPRTFEEFVARTEPAAPYKAAMLLLEEIIDNTRVGPTIIGMNWNQLILAEARIPLLTSDRPVDMQPLEAKEAYIVLPIGPRNLFIAEHGDALAKTLESANPTKVVKNINRIVVQQARKFVWGVDDSQLRFVENRMSKAPDWPVIIDEQKRRAIDAAAGLGLAPESGGDVLRKLATRTASGYATRQEEEQSMSLANDTQTLGLRPCSRANCAQTPLGIITRRGFLAAGSAAAMAGSLVATPTQAQSGLTPDAALDGLMAGNARFTAGRLSSFDEDLAVLRQHTEAKQEPFAAVLSCADSRVPVELIFDQSIGHVFVGRVAGNVCSPEMFGSLEYGAAALGIPLIMVLGHDGCGAVKAAIAGQPVPGQISALFAPIRPAVERAAPDLEATIKANAQIQADLLRTASPVIAGLVEQRKLKVVAAYYELASGRVSLLS